MVASGPFYGWVTVYRTVVEKLAPTGSLNVGVSVQSTLTVAGPPTVAP